MASTGSVAEIGERGRDRWEKLDQPRAGWVAWNAATAGILVHDGGGWSPVEVALDLLVRSSGVEPAKAVLGSSVSVAVEEELISSLSGASVDTALAIIPARHRRRRLRAGSARLTGATRFDVGVAGETDTFGAALGIAAGSTNAGVIAPTAYCADTPVRLTGNGADFAGGALHVAVHSLRIGVPAA